VELAREGDGAATAPSAMPVWEPVPPGRLVNRGFAVADHLEAYDWTLLEDRPGFLRIDAHLPPHLCNPQGMLFGGYTGTYVDFVSLHAIRAGEDRTDPDLPRHFIVTINMRIDYFEPLVGPRFVMEAEVVNQRGKTSLVAMRMLQDDVTAVYALTTLRTTDTRL